MGLAAAAQGELERGDLANLGKILGQCVDAGNLVERCLELLHAGLEAGSLPLDPTQVATVVFGGGFPIEAGEFLPEPEEARETNDRAALNLLARHYLARYDDERETIHLERAWEVTQTVLADGEVSDTDKQEALKRAVDVAPRIREELGQVWLDESFTDRPERGMEILSTIGSAASTGLVAQAMDPDQRFRTRVSSCRPRPPTP